MTEIDMRGPDELVVGGRARIARCDAFPPLPFVPFSEPPPVLSPDGRDDLARLLRGSWFWCMRKVLGLRVSDDDKYQFAVSRSDLDTAHSVFVEKAIQPSVWLAWRAKAFTRDASTPMPLGWLLAARVVSEPQSRGWFRRSTEGWFGGKSSPTETQADVIVRWRQARSHWARGVHTDDALDLAGLDPVSLDLLLSRVGGELEAKRTRCATRSNKGDPMPVLPPELWPFGLKEKKVL